MHVNCLLSELVTLIPFNSATHTHTHTHTMMVQVAGQKNTEALERDVRAARAERDKARLELDDGVRR